MRGTIKTGKEVSLSDIHRTQQDFISASKRTYLAGYDGVEMHWCHSYLISRFLNKRVNKREDIYGTDSQLFVIEIVDGIRAETSEDFIVDIRLVALNPHWRTESVTPRPWISTA